MSVERIATVREDEFCNDGSSTMRMEGVITSTAAATATTAAQARVNVVDARIVVVVTYGQDNEDFEASMQYIVENRLGTVVSDSWEEDLDLIAGL